MNVTNQNQLLVRNELGHYCISLTILFLMTVETASFVSVDASTSFVFTELNIYVSDMRLVKDWF